MIDFNNFELVKIVTFHNPELISVLYSSSHAVNKVAPYGFRVKESSHSVQRKLNRSNGKGMTSSRVLMILHLPPRRLWFANHSIVLPIGKVLNVFRYYGNQATKIFQKREIICCKDTAECFFSLFVTAYARIATR